MDLRERATVVHYHRHRMAAWGAGTVEALGWSGPDSQTLRFEAIAGALDLEGRSLLDVGCGHGDLRGFLGTRFGAFSYLGLEQVPEFVAEALRRYGALPSTWFHQCDAAALELPAVDYVAASGVLSYRCASPTFHEELIGRMYAAARVALVFNVLDAARFPDHPLLRGHDVAALERFARTLSPRVDVVRGYLPDDVTFRLGRDAA
jgi:trans-aconitate methyltransferase